MTSLIFLCTLLSLFILGIILINKLTRRRPVLSTLKKMGSIISAYVVLWIVFKIFSHDVVVPYGTDLCFDDWCATITQISKGPAVQKQFVSINADSIWVILHIRVSNDAAGIAQKPSEPAIHIIDDQGNSCAFSTTGQQLLEKTMGKQAGIDSRLELHQSLETVLVYATSKEAKGLKVVIEEGPFITKLLFPGDQKIFLVN